MLQCSISSGSRHQTCLYPWPCLYPLCLYPLCWYPLCLYPLRLPAVDLCLVRTVYCACSHQQQLQKGMAPEFTQQCCCTQNPSAIIESSVSANAVKIMLACRVCHDRALAAHERLLGSSRTLQDDTALPSSPINSRHSSLRTDAADLYRHSP